MVDQQPSDDLDDLFDFRFAASTPAQPGQVHASRRAAREAESGSRRQRTPQAAPKRLTKAAARSAGDRKRLSRSAKDRRAVAKAVRASTPKAQRKNPLSVLLTMGMVGGMFVVAGLPAYALSTTQTADVADLDVQSLVIAGDATALSAARDGYRATTPEQLAQMSKDALRAANNAEYLASGARELGDDYPWPYELTSGQGGGLSPLNYFYRECVDFVAWRLNRDQGYYAAPFKWVWSTLTPTGGNASQWRYAWQQHGWTISDTPVVGAVAWFPNNHVAYVKTVNADGTVVIEEYNRNFSHVYSQRVIPITAVDDFLYPPS
ncbi:MAG: CHAP domain-containing protein [Rhodoglobus sp.]